MGRFFCQPGDSAAQHLVRVGAGVWLFADGGVIESNPSSVGGTLAWRIVVDGFLLASGSGVYLPRRFQAEDEGFVRGAPVPVTNNVAEMAAVLAGLDAAVALGFVPQAIASDSKVTLGRLSEPGPPWSGLCVSEMQTLQQRWSNLVDLHFGRHWSGVPPRPDLVLLQGHPTKPELLAGVGNNRGYPVHAQNKLCDEQCAALAKTVQSRQSCVPERIP